MRMKHAHYLWTAALAAVLCSLLVACLTDRTIVTSEFPPKGFYLEVRTTVTTADGLQETQRFQVWEQGMSVYREANKSLVVPGPDSLVLPLFRKVSAYRMAPESTRTLSRMVYRSGFFEMQALAVVPEPRGTVISVFCREWTEREVQVHGQLYGQIARVLHVINSFLPEGHRFEPPLMTGEQEPPHLAAVPELGDSWEQSLLFHKDLVEMFPDDVGLLVDAFALAFDLGDREFALQALARIEALPGSGDDGRIFPAGTGADLAVRLRTLF